MTIKIEHEKFSVTIKNKPKKIILEATSEFNYKKLKRFSKIIKDKIFEAKDYKNTKQEEIKKYTFHIKIKENEK